MADQEHSFANPGPAGLAGLCVACFIFFALLTGRVTHDATPIMAFWLMGAAVVQLAAGLIELKDKALLGGNLMTFFGAFFCVTGAANFLGKHLMHANGVPFDAAIDGWGWLAATIFLLIMVPAYLKTASKAFFLTLVAAVVGVALLAFQDLGWVSGMSGAIAYALLITGILAFWNIAAMIINPVYGKEIIWTGKPFI